MILASLREDRLSALNVFEKLFIGAFEIELRQLEARILEQAGIRVFPQSLALWID